MKTVLAVSLAALAGSAAAKTATSAKHHNIAQSRDDTLASKHFKWGALPYQVDTDPTGRGPQFGYNICNSTTEGPTSNCQTAVINSLADFCLWGPPTPNSDVADTEAASVAWCTQPGHGTRIIPQGAITGAQFMVTPDYIQITGHITQAGIDMDPNDGGGEMDPHGADERGNPLGGLVFTTAWGNGYTQGNEWHNFMGSDVFCFKVCNPAGKNAAEYCQHIYDRIGCDYNAPAAYVDGEFTSCLGDSQDFPGVYTGDNGVVTTYTQPAESLGPISTMPYTARIPASSSCTTYTSSLLYTANPAATAASSSAAVVATTTPAAVSSSSAAPAAVKSTITTTTKAGTSASASASSNAAGAPTKFGMGGVWGVAVGVVGAAIGAVVAL